MKAMRFAWTLLPVVLSACTWVEPTKQGSEVVLAETSSVEGCKRVGTASSSVKHEVGIFSRSEDKVREELETLGKNQAAEMGGDTIIAKGPPVDGSMNFDVYKCRD